MSKIWLCQHSPNTNFILGAALAVGDATVAAKLCTGERMLAIKLPWGDAHFDLQNEVVTGRCRDGTDFSIPVNGEGLNSWLKGEQPLASALPELSEEHREVLASGFCPGSFDLEIPQEPPEVEPEPRWPPERRVPRSR